MNEMYQLAREQAAAVKEMVELLRNINSQLTVIADNQGELFDAIADLSCRVAILEDDTDLDDLEVDYDSEDELFNEYEDDCDYDICDCDEYDEGEISIQELMEMAMLDIDDLVSTPQLPYRQFGSTFYEYTPNKEYPRVQFVVNEEKRTVVALIKDDSGKVIKGRKGKARCAPDDEFNLWIGMVIACYRLFDYDVPEIFVN